MSPLFVTSSPAMLPNWRAAFPDSNSMVGLSTRFDRFDTSIIFLNYMNLAADKRPLWLAHCVETERKVIVLSPTPSEREAIQVIKGGALGYGHTLAATVRLREMVMVVDHGGLWVGGKLLKQVLSAISVGNNRSDIKRVESERTQKKIVETLTPKEQEVATLVATGATNQEVSGVLRVTERTIKMHITAVFEKLNVRNRVELALLMNNVPVNRDAIQNRSKTHVL